jgi:hypothetical protein
VNKQHNILPSSPIDVFFGLATQGGDLLFTQDDNSLGFDGIAFIDSKEYIPTLVVRQSNRSLLLKTYKPSLTSKKIDYTLNLKTYVFEQSNKQHNQSLTNTTFFNIATQNLEGLFTQNNELLGYESEERPSFVSFDSFITQDGDLILTQSFDKLGVEGLIFTNTIQYVPELHEKQNDVIQNSLNYEFVLTEKIIEPIQFSYLITNKNQDFLRTQDGNFIII